jgi:hypothetical protein
MTVARSAGLLAAAPLLALVAVQTPTATAGVKPGTIKYFNGGLHRPGGSGRPVLPRIVVRNTGDGWRATTEKATFLVDLYVEAGRYSDIRTIWGTVHGTPRYLKVLFSKPSGGKARKVRVTGGRFIAHANGLGHVTRMAEQACATFGPAAAGTRVLVRQINLDIRVSSYRNTVQVYRYYPKVDVAVICQRLPAAAPSTSNPHRNRPAFRVTSAHIRFFKENKRLCPKQVSMQVRLYGTAPGKARIRVVRSDGRIVLTGGVDVKRVGNRYTGTYLKLDRARGPQNFRYRVVVTRGGRVTSRWIRLRVRCGAGGGSFTN